MTLFFDKLQNIILNNNIYKIKNKYIELLSNLTTTKNLNDEDFFEIINKIHKIGAIYVCYYYKNDEIEIIASGTIIIEPKIIHSGKNVGHIEDIVVHPKHQGKG